MQTLYLQPFCQRVSLLSTGQLPYLSVRTWSESYPAVHRTSVGIVQSEGRSFVARQP